MNAFALGPPDWSWPSWSQLIATSRNCKALLAITRANSFIIRSLLRAAVFSTASAFVRTNSLRQSTLSVSVLSRNTRRTATTMATWDATREKSLKNGSNNKGDVLYWMARDQRAADNWALLRAASLAKENGAKARVAETLRFFGVETVDLYSLHSAFNFLNDAKARADLAGAWRALVELQKAL